MRRLQAIKKKEINQTGIWNVLGDTEKWFLNLPEDQPSFKFARRKEG